MRPQIARSCVSQTESIYDPETAIRLDAKNLRARVGGAVAPVVLLVAVVLGVFQPVECALAATQQWPAMASWL